MYRAHCITSTGYRLGRLMVVAASAYSFSAGADDGPTSSSMNSSHFVYFLPPLVPQPSQCECPLYVCASCTRLAQKEQKESSNNKTRRRKTKQEQQEEQQERKTKEKRELFILFASFNYECPVVKELGIYPKRPITDGQAEWVVGQFSRLAALPHAMQTNTTLLYGHRNLQYLMVSPLFCVRCSPLHSWMSF